MFDENFLSIYEGTKQKRSLHSFIRKPRWIKGYEG
jgi:hypothetical protein